MKRVLKTIFIILTLMITSLLLLSCSKKTKSVSRRKTGQRKAVVETTKANETETEVTKETVKEYVTNNDNFIIDEDSDKPIPNGLPSSIPPGFKNPWEIATSSFLDASDRPAPPPGGQATKPDTYNAVNTYEMSDTISKLEVKSTEKDENAIYVTNKSNVIINNFDITRTSDNSTGGDTASFYGVGAAALVTSGTLFLSDGTINTDANGGAGVFSYDSGLANIENATITTKKDTSGGIHVAGGGTLSAKNVTATTNGESSAAIRSDRGGGRMVVSGGSYTTNGTGSPAVYCTADITVTNSKLTANNSEGICIEGLNTLTLNSVNLTSSMHDDEQNDNTWSVIVYQSMSGDSEVGKGTFNMNGGVIHSKNGGIFYTTNTESEFNIMGVQIDPSDDCEFLLQVTGNKNKRGWGEVGKNGANCVFNATSQVMEGNIIVDSISTLSLNLNAASLFTGDIIVNNNYTGGVKGDGYVDVSLDNSSVWVISQDTSINNLVYRGRIVDNGDQIVPIYDTKGNLLIDGESSLKVTVNSFEE